MDMIDMMIRDCFFLPFTGPGEGGVSDPFTDRHLPWSLHRSRIGDRRFEMLVNEVPPPPPFTAIS